MIVFTVLHPFYPLVLSHYKTQKALCNTVTNPLKQCSDIEGNKNKGDVQLPTRDLHYLVSFAFLAEGLKYLPQSPCSSSEVPPTFNMHHCKEGLGVFKLENPTLEAIGLTESHVSLRISFSSVKSLPLQNSE